MIGKITLSAFHHTLIVIILLQTLQNVIIHVNGDRGSFVGCYHQNLYLRQLTIFSGSSDTCIDACEALYFRYAVLGGNACLCTNTISETELKADECDRPCTENHVEFCGGEYAQSYYDTGVNVPGPPTQLQVIKRTENSIRLQWSAPEQVNSLSRYVIWANLTRTYGTKMLSTLPQWTIEKTDKLLQYEVSNLNPGSTYNISIRSHSEEYGGGGLSWIIAETDIGEPDPEPPQPTILKSDGRATTIEIPSLVNNNGPITAIQVVVVFVDAELSQPFDENLLKGYSQALEDGTNYYITAELQNEKTARTFVVGNGLNYGGYDNVPLPLDRTVHIKLGILSRVGNMTKKRYSADQSTELYETKQLFVIGNQMDDGSGLETALLIGCSFLGILLVLSIIGYVYLRLKMDPQLQRLPSDHHELTLQGPMMEMESNTAYQPDSFPQKKFDDQLNELLDQIDLDKNHARNSLVLDVNNVIATGHYGDIISGKLQTKPSHVHVISDDMETYHQMQFLKDLAGLVRLNSHKNLIEFYGICKSNNWLYLLFEDVGTSLKTVLINSRMTAANSNSITSLSELFVVQMLCELSSAMEFLHSKKFIHGKLASYNIWITNENIPKIGCFGTVFNSHGKAIDLSRWSAPEVLRFQHYSTQSDIWSFGCLIWECCSLGGTLFSSINSNDLASRIKEGALPERISYVHDDMYQLLLNCWQLEPSERTSFSEITSVLWQFLSSPQHILSFKRLPGRTLPYYSPSLEEQSF